ncbi:MAG: GNAT family N-acetyltransferase [Gammaproteobacteria bacterium]
MSEHSALKSRADSPVHSPGLFRAESITVEQLFGSLTSEWEALHRRLSPRTPFTSPLWSRLWWQHYPCSSATVRDQFFAQVVRDGNGSLVAVAPMMVTARPGVGPLQMRTLQFFGTDPNVTEIRGLACLPEHEAAVIEALRSHLEQHSDAWDWIDWGSVRQENWQNIAESLHPSTPVGVAEIESYYLELPSTWEEFRSSRSRNIKESIRKCYNSLKRDGHHAELRVVQSQHECADALATFFRLHTDRSLVTNTVVHGDVFRKERDRAFLGAYAHAMAERGQLRIFQLVIAGEVVATRPGFIFGDELYLYYSGYDRRWGRYSVMTTLVVEAIKWAIENRFRIVNLSTGRDVSKLRWSPSHAGFRSLIQLAPRWSARVSFSVYQRLRRLMKQPSVARLTAAARR